MVKKTEWPELVGGPAGDAVATIGNERAVREVVVLPEDAITTMDYREDRVRVFVDADNSVSRVPAIG